MYASAPSRIKSLVFALTCLGNSLSPSDVIAEDATTTDLILTLTDSQWLDNDHAGTPNGVVKQKHHSPVPLISPNGTSRPVDVDCGVDSNPVAADNNSWGSRLVGECNFNYQY